MQTTEAELVQFDNLLNTKNKVYGKLRQVRVKQEKQSIIGKQCTE